VVTKYKKGLGHLQTLLEDDGIDSESLLEKAGLLSLMTVDESVRMGAVHRGSSRVSFEEPGGLGGDEEMQRGDS